MSLPDGLDWSGLILLVVSVWEVFMVGRIYELVRHPRPRGHPRRLDGRPIFNLHPNPWTTEINTASNSAP